MRVAQVLVASLALGVSAHGKLLLYMYCDWRRARSRKTRAFPVAAFVQRCLTSDTLTTPTKVRDAAIVSRACLLIFDAHGHRHRSRSARSTPKPHAARRRCATCCRPKSTVPPRGHNAVRSQEDEQLQNDFATGYDSIFGTCPGCRENYVRFSPATKPDAPPLTRARTPTRSAS